MMNQQPQQGGMASQYDPQAGMAILAKKLTPQGLQALMALLQSLMASMQGGMGTQGLPQGQPQPQPQAQPMGGGQ